MPSDELTAAMKVLDVQGSPLDVAVFALRLIHEYEPYGGYYRRGDGPRIIARTALQIIEARGYPPEAKCPEPS